jgi:hypothetical protein
MVTATLNSSKVPTVFSLYNSNPQKINRFIVGYNSNTYAYTLFTDSTTPLTFDSTLYIFGSLTSFNAIQFTSRLSLTSSESIIVNGSSTMTVFTSINPAVVTQVQLADIAPYNYVASLYVSSLSSWVLFSIANPSSLLFSSNPSSSASWTNNSISGTHPTQTTYLTGFVLGYFNGKILIGGTGLYPLVYATITSVPADETVITITSVLNQRITQVYQIVSSPDIVVACGVDDGTTIQYSLNGIQWNEAVMSEGTWPHAITTDVVYGGAIAGWLAIGVLKVTSLTAYSSVLYSSDGITWTTAIVLAEPLTSLQFDGSDWCIVSGANGNYLLRRHDPLRSTMTDITTWAEDFIPLITTTSLISLPTPIFTSTGTPNLTVYIGVTPNGPIFTSPTVTTVLLYQYVVMTPIVFTATSVVDSESLPVTYFLDSSLPPGMFWNSLTATLSGRSVELGTYTVVVYAQSTGGVNKITVTFIVSRVPINPTLPTAASHTSFIREKVIADAATSSLNNRITPSEVGPFLLERPPAVTTAPEICCKEPTRSQA